MKLNRLIDKYDHHHIGWRVSIDNKVYDIYDTDATVAIKKAEERKKEIIK